MNVSGSEHMLHSPIVISRMVFQPYICVLLTVGGYVSHDADYSINKFDIFVPHAGAAEEAGSLT